MKKNEPMKLKFDLFDKTDNKNISVDSITDLGEPGSERTVTIRRNGIDTQHEVTVLARRPIKES